jgi:regulator of sirC expression with transglutaminase-like and TPR domain
MNNPILHLGLIDDDAILLDAAALELAALDHPEIDLDDHVGTLTAITERLATLGGEAQTNMARAEVLAEVIAGEFGFTGDRTAYDDPANADLIRVMDRRLGLPVSLAILYVAAARRLSWPADALNTPGHVLVQIGEGTAPVLIDPFNAGRIVDPPQLAALLARVLGPDGQPTSDHLAPMTNRSVLLRLLLNQATRAEQNNDPERALTLYRRMTSVAPASGHAWWERARLELMHDDVPAARSSLSAMLEMTRDPATRTHIAAALDSLTGRER